MNLEAPPQVQPHHRLSTTCDRHPDQSFTGFCASCLRERLASLEQSTAAASSSASGRLKTSTAATALKAIFRSSVAGDNNNNNNNPKNNNRASSSYSSSSFLPELRRSKSFSGAGKREGFSGAFEPQRRSCDVRVRSTLWSLFNQDDGRKGEGSKQVEAKSLGFSGVKGPVFESREEEEEIRFSNVSVGVEEIVEEEIVEEIEAEEETQGEEEEEEEEIVVEKEEEEEEKETIEVEPEEIEEEIQEEIEEIQEQQQQVGEEEEEEGNQEEEEELKKMKDHIDQETQNKKPNGRDLKEIAGSFLFAASAFSKKLQNWRRKQKSKKHVGRDASSTTMQVEQPYSEIADYGFGRRSCDIDPRFSLDAARMSFDDPRYSWDEPRASWDGYLIGRTFPKIAPMVSVVEDAPVPVQRSDNQIPVEEPRNSITENDITPGGSAQTRDYYSDSQRRRKSFERSSSMRKKASGLVQEAEETKLGSNAKEVSPTSSEQLHGPKLVGTDRDWRDSNSNSLREEYHPESLESGFKDSGSVCGGIERKGSKKSRRWSKPWNIWALIYRRGGSKDEEEERYHRGNVVERSLSESWQELRREPNGDSKGGLNRVFRSNSSVSARNSFSSVKSGLETNGNGGNGKKRREEFVLERNRSARYSPTNIDNGLLRFYLTPMNRRNGSGKSRPKKSHSIANSVLRLY